MIYNRVDSCSRLIIEGVAVMSDYYSDVRGDGAGCTQGFIVLGILCVIAICMLIFFALNGVESFEGLSNYLLGFIFLLT